MKLMGSALTRDAETVDERVMLVAGEELFDHLPVA